MLLHFDVPYLGINFSFCSTRQRAIEPQCRTCHGHHNPVPKFLCSSVQSHEVLVCPQCRRNHLLSNNWPTLVRKYQRTMLWWTMKTWERYTQRKPQSRFLDLPRELRQQIYQYLFAGEHLEYVVSKHDSRSRPNRFRSRDLLQDPCLITTKRFYILLTCRQCFREGLALYYRSATAMNVSLGRFRSLRRDERANWPEGSTTNMGMIRRYGKRVIETPARFQYPDGNELAQMESLEEVIIRLPFRERDEATDSPNPYGITHHSPPKDEELAYYHGIALPTDTREPWWGRLLKHRTYIDGQSDTEDDWIQFLNLRPRVKISIQFLTRYNMSENVIWEVRMI